MAEEQIVTKSKSLQIRLNYPENSESFMEHLAANENNRFIRLRHYELVEKGRNHELLTHAGLFELPQVQEFMQTIGASAPRMVQLLPAALPKTINAGQAVSPSRQAPALLEKSADPLSDTSDTEKKPVLPSIDVQNFNMIDASQWVNLN